jgi:TolB-like protein/DNA-binding winged helix-turn-helix (wHTH) protein
MKASETLGAHVTGGSPNRLTSKGSLRPEEGLESPSKKIAKMQQIPATAPQDRAGNTLGGLLELAEAGGREGIDVGDMADIFLFEDFRLDRRGDGLCRRDERGVFVPITIGPRALDVLAVLVARTGELVSKEEIMAAVWRRTVVESANLTVQISALRRVLDYGRSEGSCIQTVAARGYRFVVPVTRVERSIPPTGRREAAAMPAERAILTEPRRPHRRFAAIAAAVSAVLVTAGLAWWIWPPPRSQKASAPASVSAMQLVAPRLSIVVLPFANLSNDPDQQYFADGITEDLTTDLSTLPNMLVIARNTAFTYKNKPIDAKQIGREFGVRYLLEGSVQRSGTQVRVTTQLIDAETGTHLYAERFDRPLGDLFALQNDVTSRIAVALNLELVAAEAGRPSEKPDALEYILRGRAALARGPPTRESKAEGIALYERALAAQPGSIDAQSRLADGLIGRVLDGLSDSPEEDVRRAETLLTTASAAAPRDPFLHYLKGQILRAVAQGPFGLDAAARTARFADAIPEYAIVLAAIPNAVGVIPHLAWCKFMTGAEEEAIPLLEKAIRLSPRDPFLFLWYTRLGAVHFFQGRLDEAILWLDKARRANPPFPPPHALLAAAYGLKGDLAHAAAELAESGERAKARNDNRFATIPLVRKNGDLNAPLLHDRFEEFFITGLRKAGLPEE